MDGFLNVLKPPGMTSHDVVNVVRRAARVKQVGHTGTLDPGAAGVLVVGIGFAVRLMEYLDDSSKTYRAEVTFGMETDTGDAQGRVTGESDASKLSERDLGQALTGFVGEVLQRPPAHSAIQVDGRRLHELARRGIAVDAPPRKVSIRRIDLLRFVAGSRPRAMLEMECSAGTYVRSLAADLGAQLGCGAYLSFLVRTRAGRFEIETSMTLEELAEAVRDDAVGERLVSIQHALSPIATIYADDEMKRRILHGNPVRREKSMDADLSTGALTLIEDDRRKVLAIARCAATEGDIVLQPLKVVSTRSFGREEVKGIAGDGVAAGSA